MKLLAFLKKVIAAVANLFRKMPADAKAAVHVGVILVENLKMLIDSPVIDILTAIIPGDIDDKLKVLLRAKLPEILIKLRLVDTTLGLTDPNEIAAAALATLRNNGFISENDSHSLAILVAQIAADNKLSWSDGAYVMEWYYRNEYKQAA